MRFVRIPIEALSQQALDGLIEEFVTREGTDYGIEEHTFDDKHSALIRQLDRGDAVIVFDPQTETTNIVTRDELELCVDEESR